VIVAARVARLWFVRSWRAYIAPAVTIMLCFGLGFFAMAAARRTQSAYPRLLRDVRASTLSVGTVGVYDPATNAAIAAIPEVERSRTFVGVDLGVEVDGRPDPSQVIEATGTFDGRYFDQDRFTPTQGRLADPGRVDEVVVNEFLAKRFGYHVGQVLDLGVYETGPTSDPASSPQPPPPHARFTVTVVGIGLWPDEVVQDDADRIARLLVTPALTRLVPDNVTFGWQGLILRRGDADLPAFLAQVQEIVPLDRVETRVTSIDAGIALDALAPLSLVVGAFGAVASAAGVLLSCQALGRAVRTGRDDRQMLVAFGATNRAVIAASASTSVAAVLTGLAGAIALAVAASPAAPLGPVRRVEADPGIDVDATVLIGGAALVALALIAWSTFAVWRDLRARHTRPVPVRPAKPLRAVTGRRLRPAATVGVRFALSRGQGSGVARSALLSAITAMIAVVATVTFVGSLSRMVDTPAAYGWNFDAAIIKGNGYDNLDLELAHQILGDDPDVEDWSGAYFGAGTVGGVEAPLLGMVPNSVVHPRLVSGRFLADDGELVLGTATAAALHASIGDRLVITGGAVPQELTVVGTALLPTIGRTHAERTTLGRGAIVAPRLVPGSDVGMLGNRFEELPGPNALFVRFRDGVASRPVLDRLRRSTAPLNSFSGLDVLGPQRPAAVVSAGDVGAAPSLLTAALVIGGGVSLLIALGTSVRAHRRELGVLSALGFTGWQRAATVLWQSSVVVLVGIVFGLPGGTLAGRALWRTFTDHIEVVAGPVAPWLIGGLVLVVALVLANALALGPARHARRLDIVDTLRDR
jgi:hypothetical protein